VYWNAGVSGAPYVLLEPSTLGMNTYFQQSGLTAGTYYKYKVRARNYIGLSPFSRSVTIIAANVPLPPINLARIGSTTSTVSFGWDPNPDNGGSAVRDYLAFWDGGNALLTAA
jgi:hypothetical protein